MKGRQMNAIMLGLGWLASLGVVFVLGILSAFAFHLGPGAGNSTGDLSMNQRDMMLTIERYTGKPTDIAAIMSIGANEGVPAQLEQALRSILRLTDIAEREQAATSLANGLPPRNLMAVIRFLQELQVSPARDQVLGECLEAWAAEDGRRAIAFASSLDAISEKELAIQSVLKGWSRVEPALAWGWVLEQTGATRRAERWLAIIFSNLGSIDRSTAFNLLEEIPASGFQDNMAQIVMEQLLTMQTPREAIDWLGEFPSESRLAAATILAENWAVTEPAEATNWLNQSFPRQIDALARVLVEWVYQDPEQAADWVWSTFRSPDRRELIEVVAAEWIANDGLAPLANWLNTHGPSPALDGAISQLAIETARMDPATALNWVQFIEDDDSRSMMEIVLGRQWLRSDPAQASNQLPALVRSDSARAALLETVALPVQEEMPESPGELEFSEEAILEEESEAPLQ